MSRNKQFKTSGADWLWHSMAAFNGSGYADKYDAQTYIDSYRAYKTMRKDAEALRLLTNYQDYAQAYAEKLCMANDASHKPSEKGWAKFQKFYSP